MKQYDVTGMSCAACAARVEQAVKKVNGVTACSVSLLTNAMAVEGGDEAAVCRAVADAGYGATPKKKRRTEEDVLADRETPKLKKRLWVSLAFLAALLLLSMGPTVGLRVPGVTDAPVLLGVVEMLLALCVMAVNRRFFVSGVRGVCHGAPNMDTLVALGSFASFAWSVAVLIRAALGRGEADGAYYFESAAMILTLITVGKMLEARAKGRTTDAIRTLMRLAPQTATVRRNGTEVEIPVDDVAVGDVFLLRPGETVPVDGVVLEGNGAVNEAALTGESLPVDKTAGDRVNAATQNETGFLVCRAERVGVDTTLSHIIALVEDAAATKAPIAKIADRVAAVFVPAVLVVAAVTLAVWLVIGQPLGFALARAISVLVISCPCALGLATPVAIMVANGVGARHGILFKTAASLEGAGRCRTVVLDKTGTVTAGIPAVTDVLPACGTQDAFLALAASLETGSEHPLARAVRAEAEKRNLPLFAPADFAALPGNGVKATVEGRTLLGGSLRFVADAVPLADEWHTRAAALAGEGKTPLLFAADGVFLGLIAVADPVKEGSAAAIRELKNLGCRVVLLTGDNARTAHAIAARVGIDEVYADVLPADKEETVRRLAKDGAVMMVGDGINDAPALVRADVGVAIGAGADVAVDCADVVLMKSDLRDVPAVLRLSRAAIRNIRENLFWAFFYNAVGIPLAAGCFVSLGLTLNPMFGAAAMSASSFCVVFNALRLNFTKLYDSRRDRALRKEKTAVRVLSVTGMMCENCEKHVSAALTAFPGVRGAEANHRTGSVTVTLSRRLPDRRLVRAIEKEGYGVISITDRKQEE